jgi:hypothetical protein
MNSSNSNPFQSRWGFHPCDYNLFLKLKYLHKRYWQTIYDFHRWHRWWRKQEHNRVVPEPAYCRIFSEEAIWFKPVKVHGVDGFRIYPKTILDHGIVNLYQAARRPQAAPVQHFDSGTIHKIEQLYSQVVAFAEK